MDWESFKVCVGDKRVELWVCPECAALTENMELHKWFHKKAEKRLRMMESGYREL